MKDEKIFWFDVETTGLDPKQNDITQLAFILEINGNIVEEGNLFMKPINDENITDEALQIQGRTREEVLGFPEAMIQYKELESVLRKHIDQYNRDDKATMAAYNGSFDRSFLYSLREKLDIKYGLGSYLKHVTIDPLFLVDLLIFRQVIPELINRKLETVCLYFGIEIQAHDALSDIRATRNLFYKLIELIDFNGGYTL